MPPGAAAIQAELSRGLALQDFVLHYQPQFHVTTGEAVALEALVRWERKGRDLIHPHQFMPFMAGNGLSMALLEHTLRLACAQGKTWRGAGYRPIKIAVNLSLEQLHHADLCPIIDSVLEGALPDIPWLELEVPAAAVLDGKRWALGVLWQLKQRGLPLALDNYGLCRIEIVELGTVPVDKIKVDGFLTRRIGEDPEVAQAVRKVIELKGNLDFTMLAAGVEKESESRLLVDWGCHLLQGNLLSPPLPPDEVARTVLARQGNKEGAQ
jgi:EAL domain-containing protein (putative c-di-GMP-specific phosphodiesterase class I)